VRAEIEKGDVTAVIIEGIQGVGGVQIPSEHFLQQLQQLCNSTATTLILDEIQSGCGRSGKFFAHQWAGIKPDIITQAKGIGNGFPVGVVLISPKFEAVYGELGTTFGGNHLACAAVEAVLDVMEAENLLVNVNEVGSFLLEELKKIEGIKEVRGRGLMIGIEFDAPVKDIRRRLLFEEHVFTGVSGTNTIRLLPPLTLTMEQAKLFIDKFKKVVNS
jgi:acetylornithine aminotransferase